MKFNSLHLRQSAFLLVLTLAATHVFAVDVVVRRSDNVTLRGEITKSDNSSVTLKRTNGDEEVISVANLKSVQFEGEPSSLGPARTTERSGAFDTSLERLKEAQAAYSGARNEIKAEMAFLTARVMSRQAMADPSKISAATEALEKFRLANRANFRYLEATLLQAALHTAGNQADEGKALLTEVQASSVKGFQLQAGVELGRLLLASGDSAGAQKAFEDVISKSQNDESALSAMYDGMLGKAMCLKQQNDIDGALAILENIIEKAADSETKTLAESWVRKGDCLRQKNQPKAALMAYLHVDVLYPGEPQQHAEALLRLSQLWGPSGHADRAIDASSRLTEQYPNSPWTKQIGSGG